MIAATKEETRHFLRSRHHFRVHVGVRVALVDRNPVGFRGAVIQEDLRVEVGRIFRVGVRSGDDADTRDTDATLRQNMKLMTPICALPMPPYVTTCS